MSSRRRRRHRVSRKLLIWIGGVAAVFILLPVLAVVGLIAMIDPNSYKAQLETSLRQVLGRDLRIRGPLTVSASLTPTLQADDVTLPNMPSGSRGDMVRIERMTVELATQALLTGHLVIARIALIKPDILFETDAAGAANWRYQPQAAPPRPTGTFESPNLALLTVHVRDGRITWRDGATGSATTAELRRLSLTSSAIDAPVIASAEILYGKQRINMAAQTGPWARLIDASARTPWGLFANFESGGAKLTITGALTRPNELKGYSLRLDAAVPDLGAIAWALPWRVPPLHGFTASARLLDTGGDYPDISGVLVQSGFTNLEKTAPGLTLDSLRMEMPRLSEPMVITAEGAFASSPLRVSATLGPPILLLPNAPTGQGYNVDIAIEAAGASFAVRGAIADPVAAKGMDIAVGARIPDLGLLSTLIGVRLPLLRTIAFAGQLTDGEGGYLKETALRNIVLTLPQGDVSGDIAVALRERPRVRTMLKSSLLDLDSILAAWDESKPQEAPSIRRQPRPRTDVTVAPTVPRRSETMLPDTPVPFDGLKLIDADFRASVDTLRAGGAAYRDVAASVVLSDGRLVANPISAELGGGRAELRLALDARQPVATVVVAAKAQGVDIRAPLAAWGVPGVAVGKIDLDGDFQASGASWHELAGATGGRLALSLTDGELDTRLAHGTMLDVLRAMRSGNDRVEGARTRLRCLTLALEAAKGAVTVTQAGLDSARLFGTLAGRVNLTEETMQLQVRSYLRTGAGANPQGVTAVPLKLEGTWQDPKVSADPPATGRPALITATDACAPSPLLRRSP